MLDGTSTFPKKSSQKEGPSIESEAAGIGFKDKLRNDIMKVREDLKETIES